MFMSGFSAAFRYRVLGQRSEVNARDMAMAPQASTVCDFPHLPHLPIALHHPRDHYTNSPRLANSVPLSAVRFLLSPIHIEPVHP